MSNLLLRLSLIKDETFLFTFRHFTLLVDSEECICSGHSFLLLVLWSRVPPPMITLEADSGPRLGLSGRRGNKFELLSPVRFQSNSKTLCRSVEKKFQFFSGKSPDESSSPTHIFIVCLSVGVRLFSPWIFLSFMQRSAQGQPSPAAKGYLIASGRKEEKGHLSNRRERGESSSSIKR